MSMSTDELHLQSLFFNVSRDDLLLKSVGDFLEKRGQNGYLFLDEMKDAISGVNVTDTVSTGKVLVTNDVGQLTSASAQDILDACYNNDDTFVCDDGSVANVDDYMSELGNTASGLTAVSEVLKQNYQDTIINGSAKTSVSDVISRLQTRFVDISDTAANVAYNTIDVVGNTTLSVKERVMRIMNYIQGNADDWDGIGQPSSEFQDAAQYSAAVVFSLNAIGGASTVADMVKNTFIASWGVLKNFFVSAWDKLTGKIDQTFDVIDGDFDSFKIDYDIKNNHFNNVGVSFIIDNYELTDPDIWKVDGNYNYEGGYEDLLRDDTLEDRLHDMVAIINNRTSIICNDLQEYAYEVCRLVGQQSPTGNESIDYLLKAAYNFILYDRHFNPDDFANVWVQASSLMDKVIEVYKALYMIAYPLYAYINNFEYDQYVHVNLPAGELYMWRDKDEPILYGKILTSPVIPDWSTFLSIFNGEDLVESDNLISWFSNQYENTILTDDLAHSDDETILKWVGHSMFLNYIYLYLINNWFNLPSHDPYVNLQMIADDFNEWLGLTDGSNGSQNNCITIVPDQDHQFVTAISIGSDWYTNYDTAVGYGRRLSASATGDPIQKGYLTPVSNLMSYLFQDDYYMSYERINQIFPGKFSLYTSAELVSIISHSLKITAMAVLAVIAVAFALKLKKAIYTAQGRADNMLYSAMNEETGVIDESKILDGFKLQKRANRLMLLSAATIGATKKLVTSIANSTVAFARTVYTGVTSRIKGSTNSRFDEVDTDAAKIINLISGN